MAILAIVTGKMSKSQYESVRKEVKWETEHPAGAIFHAASFDAGDRIHVADVWESEAAMTAFFEKRLIPAVQKLGIAPPESVVFPIHNLDAFKGIEKYRV